MTRYNYSRRPTVEVRVASVGIGSSNPVRLQSMTNLSTNDIEGCTAQSIRIADAGGELVRLTTQGVREADSAGQIRRALHDAGCDVPLVADVHFNPKAAFRAAETVDKVRINPGNFVDAARTFKHLEYTDAEYAAELDKIRGAFLPFLEICRKNGTAVRLGVNHGSLSDRIMSRYGDTPAGMVESVMEFLRIAREADFDRIVISIKASDTVVMTRTVRLLVEKMDAEDMHFPLHLGVTEAGDGDDGRVKSAVGIGSLLADGLGDTIRVSLSEEPEAEIPVAKLLADYIAERENHTPIPEPERTPEHLHLPALPGFEKMSWPVAFGVDFTETNLTDAHFADASQEPIPYGDKKPMVLTSSHTNRPGELRSWIDRFVLEGGDNPVIVRLLYTDTDPDSVRVKAAADLGTLLLQGYCSGIWLEAPSLSADDLKALELGILQATGKRISKTEFVSCPGCGRTLFDLQKTVARVKAATSHLKGLKIGVMGCIVNGPGEMAGADYGYVGAARGKISLYKGKQCIAMNIPEEEAVDRLIALIREGGDWHDPQ